MFVDDNALELIGEVVVVVVEVVVLVVVVVVAVETVVVQIELEERGKDGIIGVDSASASSLKTALMDAFTSSETSLCCGFAGVRLRVV